jgi:hypothetical protein
MEAGTLLGAMAGIRPGTMDGMIHGIVRGIMAGGMVDIITIILTDMATVMVITMEVEAAIILPPGPHQEEIMLIVHRQEVLPEVMETLSEVLPVATAEV